MIPTRARFLCFSGRTLILCAVALHSGRALTSFGAEAPSYNFDIRPILSQNCFSCHGPDEESRKAHLRLDSYEGATAVHKDRQAINPDNLSGSHLIRRITSTDPDEQMPPPDSNNRLSADQIALLTRWVKSGAEYAGHWSFAAPKKSAPPMSGALPKRWSENEIDQFIFAKLKASKLSPMPEADKSRLLRRVTFDLTGLPPSLEALDAFLADTSEEAYEKVVDRLLASEQYGERMALAWMDAARYGDSSVMHADGPRTMWPWRDWVINAYNSNMPFDQFTVEQLGGDLIPDASDMQKLATGFNRNNASSDEGGAFPEELRVEYIVDRVKTTANVWLGLSMECAQCHDHKYDPISNRDYYEFFAYFNNNADPGMQNRNGNEKPVIQLQDSDSARKLADIERERAEIEQKRSARREEAAGDIADWIAAQQAEFDAGRLDRLIPLGLRHHFPLDEEAGMPFRDEASVDVGHLEGNYKEATRDGARSGLYVDGNTTIAFKDVGAFAEFDAPLTMVAWIKSKDTTTGSILARMDESNKHRGFDLILTDGSVGTHLINAWPANAIKVWSKTKIKHDVWQHVAVTYDGSLKAAGVKIYIDGERQENNAPDGDSLSATIKTQVPFRVGGRQNAYRYSGDVADVRIYDVVLSQEEIAAIREGGALPSIFEVRAQDRTALQNNALALTYLRLHDEAYQDMTKALQALSLRFEEVQKANVPYDSMIMGDNSQMRVTYILNRGQYDSPDTNAVVTANVPGFLPAPLGEYQANRLGLAKWLVQEDHPLTARVAINRYWAMLFGSGIVPSVMDFGNQGAPPSHPELLDWLAVDFIESGWNVKRMLKQMVMSAAYRQSAKIEPGTFAVDPLNMLLSRGTRFRLQGEFIRDNALAVSGLLVPTLGGPSVKPYQPNGIWNEVSLDGGLRYTRDNGQNLYRRSMYTYWKRSAPAPNMMIFDAPTREKCLIQRPRTNTPLQALVTLNDVHFVEAARKLSERIMNEGGTDFATRVNHAFRLCMSRDATHDEMAVCRAVYEKQLTSFQATPAAAEAFLKVGDSARDENLDVVEHAAYTVLTSMILNLDEVLTRG